MAERGCYPLHCRDRIVFAMSAREDLIRRRPERGSYSLMSGGRIVLYWGVELGYGPLNSDQRLLAQNMCIHFVELK